MKVLTLLAQLRILSDLTFPRIGRGETAAGGAILYDPDSADDVDDDDPDEDLDI